jgi:hypothetical protein
MEVILLTKYSQLLVTFYTLEEQYIKTILYLHKPQEISLIIQNLFMELQQEDYTLLIAPVTQSMMLL